MKIKIIQVGKTKHAYIEEGVKRFLKRLKHYSDFKIITIREISPSQTFSVKKCISEEGQSILNAISNDDFVIALDENGKEYSSKEFAEFIRRKKENSITLTFIIGGPYGLSAEVKECANLIFSMSKMTFTHQMICLFLLEQIYRAFTIIGGKPYHHA